MADANKKCQYECSSDHQSSQAQLNVPISVAKNIDSTTSSKHTLEEKETASGMLMPENVVRDGARQKSRNEEQKLSILTESDVEIEDIERLYTERNEMSKEPSTALLPWISNIFARNRKKQQNDTRKKEVIYIMENLKCRRLAEVGTLLKQFEEMLYASHEHNFIFIKMRLVHTNFDLVKNALKINDPEKLKSYFYEQYINTVKFIYNIAHSIENDEDEQGCSTRIASQLPLSSTPLVTKKNDEGQMIDHESVVKRKLNSENKTGYEENKDHFVADGWFETNKKDCLEGDRFIETNEEDEYTEIKESHKREAECQLLIQDFKEKLLERNANEITENILSSIDILKYLNFDETLTLIKILTIRIQHERIDTAPDVFQWIFTMVITQTASWWIKICTWIFALNPIRHWAAEFLVQYLIYAGYLSPKDESEFRHAFQDIQDERLIPAIFQLVSKLDNMSIPFDLTKLIRAPPCKSYQSYDVLEKEGTEKARLDQHVIANAHLDYLRSKYGNEDVKQLSQLTNGFENGEVDIQLSIIEQFFTGHWPLTKEALNILTENSINHCEEMLNGMFYKKEVHFIKEINDLITNLQGSNEVQTEPWKNVLQKVINEKNVADNLRKTFDKEWKTNFKRMMHPSDYNEKFILNVLMFCIQQETNDPDLYLEILEKYDIPMGIIEMTTLAEETGHTIKLIYCKKGTYSFKERTLNPYSKLQENDPIVLISIPEIHDQAICHFSVLSMQSEENYGSGKNDCLLDAINIATGKNLKRADLVKRMKSCRDIRSDIKKGYYKLGVKEGCIGGAVRTSKRQNSLDMNLDKVRQDVWKGLDAIWKDHGKKKELRNIIAKYKQLAQENNEVGENSLQDYVQKKIASIIAENKVRTDEKGKKKITKDTFIDKADVVLEKKKKVVRVGNHELVAREHIIELLVRDYAQEIRKEQGCIAEVVTANSFPIQWVDLTMHFRVDIRYCVFLHFNIERTSEKWTIQGHPKSICKSNKLDKRSQKVIGSKKVLHEEVGEKALNESKDPYTCAKNVLAFHLNAIGSKAKFERRSKEEERNKRDLFAQCYTVTGHNLQKEEDRKKFFTGLERERCKLALCLYKLKHPRDSMDKCDLQIEESEGNKLYIENIKKSLKNCNDVAAFGEILMQPAKI